jgi:hypothetical protein
MEQAEARKLWLEAVERVKDRTIAPTLWIALEKGHGITTEDEFFIVGYPPADAPMGGYLLSSENKRVIEKVLTELLGKPSRIKVIDGTTVNDFVVFKKREEVAENTRRQAQERKHVERAAERAWETVSEQCSRKYANTHLRQLPQIRGQFLFEAVKVISDAMDRIHPDGEIDEIGHRALGRVIERVATLTDVPGATVAVELIRLRNALKRASDS